MDIISPANSKIIIMTHLKSLSRDCQFSLWDTVILSKRKANFELIFQKATKLSMFDLTVAFINSK